MMNLLLKIALVAVILWLGLRWFERANLYFPMRGLDAIPRSFGMEFEEVWVTTTDGRKIHGWYIPAKAANGSASLPAGEAGPPVGPSTILLCHGNAGNISHRVHKSLLLHQLGLNVLVFDYRGYGESEGRPSEEGTYRDAEAMYQWLISRSPRPRVLLYGESLGGAVAAELARRHPEAAALILESSFTSAVAMANRLLPWFPARWIMRYRYDTLSKMPQIRLPVLVLHSPDDEIVPFSMGQQLFAAAAGEPKGLVRLAGGHNEGIADHPDVYVDGLRAFLGLLKQPVGAGERP